MVSLRRISLLLFALVVLAGLPARDAHGADGEASLKYVSAAVKMDLLVPTSHVNSTFAIHLGLRYLLPWWNPNLSFGFDLGYYPMWGEGQNMDAQIGLYDYSWRLHLMPLSIGPQVDIPTGIPWLVPFGEVGYTAIFAWSRGKSFGTTTKQSDVAHGYYLGGGVEFRFGRFGGVLGQYRYTGTFLDFGYPQYNLEPGDIGGHSVRVGYRYIF